MDELVSSFADLVSYAAPITCIFGFTRYALRMLHDVFDGGRVR